MKLFKISQNVNNGYDTYDSAVVVAESAEAAKLLNPAYGDWGIDDEWGNACWVGPELVSVEYLGEAAEGMRPGIICASFNAG